MKHWLLWWKMPSWLFHSMWASRSHPHHHFTTTQNSHCLVNWFECSTVYLLLQRTLASTAVDNNRVNWGKGSYMKQIYQNGMLSKGQTLNEAKKDTRCVYTSEIMANNGYESSDNTRPKNLAEYWTTANAIDAFVLVLLSSYWQAGKRTGDKISDWAKFKTASPRSRTVLLYKLPHIDDFS